MMQCLLLLRVQLSVLPHKRCLVVASSSDCGWTAQVLQSNHNCLHKMAAQQNSASNPCIPAQLLCRGVRQYRKQASVPAKSIYTHCCPKRPTLYETAAASGALVHGTTCPPGQIAWHSMVPMHNGASNGQPQKEPYAPHGSGFDQSMLPLIYCQQRCTVVMTNQLQCMPHTTTAWTGVSTQQWLHTNMQCHIHAAPTDTAKQHNEVLLLGPPPLGTTACQIHKININLQKHTALVVSLLVRAGLPATWWHRTHNHAWCPGQPHSRQGPTQAIPPSGLLKLWLHWQVILRSHRAIRLRLLLLQVRQLVLAHEGSSV